MSEEDGERILDLIEQYRNALDVQASAREKYGAIKRDADKAIKTLGNAEKNAKALWAELIAAIEQTPSQVLDVRADCIEQFKRLAGES